MNIIGTNTFCDHYWYLLPFAWGSLCWEGFLTMVVKLYATMHLHIPFKDLQCGEGFLPSPWNKTHAKLPVTSALPVGWKTSSISVSAIRTFPRSNHTFPDIFLLAWAAFIQTQEKQNGSNWTFSWLPYFSRWYARCKSLNLPKSEN